MTERDEQSAPALDCPVPISRYPQIVLGHGGGGRLTRDLLASVFLPAFGSATLAALEDQATVPVDDARIAITTDAFVVRPIFFPGGDIGRLAVCGTVNDLVVGGAEPLYLSAAFVLEEGLPVEELARVVASMAAACVESGVTIVTGDTKVVERGKGDRVYITTTGVGRVPPGRALSIAAARPGDRILVSGPLGDHGVAILSVRDGLEFESELRSDCAPLVPLTRALFALDPSPSIRAMRDPTRGGLATVLNEIAEASNVGIVLDERRVPLRPEVRGACEILGLDPLYVPSEGRLVAIVSSDDAPRVLAAMRAIPLGAGAAEVGAVVAAHPRDVVLRTQIGGERLLPLLSGDQLPRIC